MNGNDIVSTERYGKILELDVSKTKELHEYLGVSCPYLYHSVKLFLIVLEDSLPVKEGKMFALMLKLQSIEKGINVEPRFEINDACRRNIREQCCSVILSTYLSSYSEEHPKNLPMVSTFISYCSIIPQLTYS